ncbi:MAG: HAMP domain-containing histidine kinase [Clostridia bacterium]|nr:HAMP domain-containing histidine kinase [Clostridia bacterium]
MIGKLRRKFVLFAMISIMLVTSLIFSVIAIEMRIVTDYELDHIISIIAENGGTMPEYNSDSAYKSSNYITPETRFSIRYFTLTVDSNLNLSVSNFEHIASVSESEAEKIVQDVLRLNKKKGYYNGQYRFLVKNLDEGKMIVMLDSQSQIRSYNDFVNKSTMIITLGLIITLVIASLLSKKAAGPIIEAMEKQKQFITNAGHDLKTPVAVILADADVLEMKLGNDDEWVKSIKKQAKKLDELIKIMLNLAKVGENSKKVQEYVQFDVCELVKDEVEGIKVLAKNKEIECSFLNNEINVVKDKTAIAEVLTILLDNAIKYTEDGETIKVVVGKLGKNGVKIDVSNPYNGSLEINPNRLFDRFYRGDKSRNASKEGYGIGLSMAKSIITANKGKISCYIDAEKKIHFMIVL